MKKLLVMLLAALTLTGCASEKTCDVIDETSLKEQGYVLNPLENGYVLAGEVSQVKELPAPIDTSLTYKPTTDGEAVACKAGVYAAGCSSITAANLDEYLGRDDVVYIDIRDFSDYVSKHLTNFECIPYFGLIFNAEAGSDDSKQQLFSGSPTAPVATYKESEDMIRALFPEDKALFIMCQGGGRAMQMLQILDSLGYDMSKVYNIGGMANYTDSKYRNLTTNTEEFKVEATYSINGLTKN